MMLLNTDSYKYSHFLQYPANTSYISSYIEARGGEFDQMVFFGLQIYLKEYLSAPITALQIAEAKELVTAHGLPFNEPGFNYILEKHQGYFPVTIEALAEGNIIPTRNALVQIQNTDPNCAWVTNFLETSLLRAVWYPSTVATISFQAKQIIKLFLDKTSDNPETLRFKLHDFGARGVSSLETAGIGGLAHLVNFYGTDTTVALSTARKYYGEKLAGYSIPAAEHSTITIWGKDQEKEAYQNMLTQFGGKGRMLAVVSDSYDLWHATNQIWGEELKQQVMENGATLVIRPDSGNPVAVAHQVITQLMKKFGYSINSKGYQVLPDYLRVIQGDGISLESIRLILESLDAHGISAENIAFGMGGALLQKVNRSMMEFAMKTSSACVDEKWRDVYKDPITDRNKTSQKGRLALICTEGIYQTIRLEELGNRENLLVPVFSNGKLLRDVTFQEVRDRAGF